MPYLKHSVNKTVVSIYQLASGVKIGRRETCGIQLNDATVSAEHALIEEKEEAWLISDLDSTNGIIHLDKRMSTLELKDGTTFSLGSNDFEFVEELSKDLEKTLKIKKSWIPGVYYTE